MSQKRNLATLDEFTDNEDITNGFRDKYSKRNNAEEAVPLKNSTSDARRSSSQTNTDGQEEDPESATYDDETKPVEKKFKLPFLIACIVAIAFFIIILLLVAFWPRVPSYLRGELCVDKECLDASQQMLLWADVSTGPCENTYRWACGRFESEYTKHHFFGVHKGEWNFEAFHEYEEIKNLDFFISSLPQQGYANNPATILKGLYKSCRELETLDKNQGNAQLKKAINTLGGWTLLHTSKTLEMWDYRQALTRIQPIHGAYPFFKVSVGHLDTPPYNPIITLTEGEVGLPHKVYYSLANNNEILDAYKMLLRDFAINMGIVGVEAEQFADEVFHYEKRIVTKILAVENSENRRLNQVMTLGEISKSIPLLPIFETVQATFPNTKITENTRILVQDVGVIEAMSRIITSSDVPVLNNFIVWSLARRFLPFMSREYRLPMEKFETFLYGNKTATPQWFFCSKIVRDWMPFAVDTLRQNPDLLKVPTRRYGFYDEPKDYHFVEHPIDLNSELAKLIFFHIRNTLKESLEYASWMNDTHRKAIIEKLSTISFQIGIPESVLETNEYANEYYDQFVLQNLFFVENLESLRRLEKARMEKRLKKLHAIDAIIAELYPGYGERAKSTGYLPDFNIAIISKKLAQEPYFDYRYPVALNFARLGVVVADLLLKSVTPYAVKNSNNSFIFGENPECISDYVEEKPLPNFAIKNIFSKLSSTHVAFTALTSFLDLLESSEPVVGAPLTEGANYESLHLINKKLQPGLRSYDDKKLFILASMQTHCSVSFEAYKKFKPYVEGQIAESELFRLIWTQVPHTSQEMSCSEGSRTCSDIL